MDIEKETKPKKNITSPYLENQEIWVRSGISMNVQLFLLSAGGVLLGIFLFYIPRLYYHLILLSTLYQILSQTDIKTSLAITVSVVITIVSLILGLISFIAWLSLIVRLVKTSSKEKNNSFTKQKIWITLLAVLVTGFIFIAWGSLFFLRTIEPYSKPNTLEEDLSYNSDSLQGEQNDFIEYVNTKYDYSFSYPNDFTIYSGINQAREQLIPPTDQSAEVFLTNNVPFLFCCEALTVTFSAIEGTIDTANWQEYGSIPDYRIQSQNKIVFSGREAYEVRGSTGLDSSAARVILIPGDQISFVILQNAEGDQWESIVNSFRFR